MDKITNDIYEHFFKVFRIYDKREAVDRFMKRWLDLVYIYSKMDDFVSFSPNPPVLTELVPHSRSVLLIPFANMAHPKLPHTVSVFPYYPFKVKRLNWDENVKVGLELFHLYLDITGIRLVGLWNFPYQEKKIIQELHEKYHTISIYDCRSFTSFKSIVSRLRN